MQTRVAWALLPGLLLGCNRPAEEPTTATERASQAAASSSTAAASASSTTGVDARAGAAAERIVYSSLRPGNWDI
jgi:hypothetical protein